jgi:hypothetical protein
MATTWAWGSLEATACRSQARVTTNLMGSKPLGPYAEERALIEIISLQGPTSSSSSTKMAVPSLWPARLPLFYAWGTIPTSPLHLRPRLRLKRP